MTAQIVGFSTKRAPPTEFAVLVELVRRWQGLVENKPMKRLRAAAFDKLKSQPFPQKRSAPYRGLRVARLVQQIEQYQRAPYIKDPVKEPIFLDRSIRSHKESIVLVMIDGCFAPELSQMKRLPEGVEIIDLSTAFAVFPAHMMNRCVEKEAEFFSLVNSSLVDRGTVIVLPPDCKISEPVILLNICHAPDAVVSFFQVHIIAGANSAIHLVVEGRSHRGWQHFIIDIVLEKGARVDLDEQMETDDLSFSFGSIRSVLKDSAELHVASFSKGSFSTWRDIIAQLNGPMSLVDISSTSALSERRRFTTSAKVEHLRPQGRSNQWIRSALDQRARFSFCGKIYVAANASQTESYQLNNNLLLSDDAVADSQPNLEILHDDVKASHGSTTGQIGEEDLFYLQSRGISREMSRALLIKGFIDVGIEKLKSLELRKTCRAVLDEIF